MKVINSIGCVIEVIPVFPSVFFNAITFPFDQVLQFALEHVAVKYFFHSIFFFTINKFWQRWWGSCLPEMGSARASFNLTTLTTRWSWLMDGGRMSQYTFELTHCSTAYGPSWQSDSFLDSQVVWISLASKNTLSLGVEHWGWGMALVIVPCHVIL